MAIIRLDPTTFTGTATFKSLGRVSVALVDEGPDKHGVRWGTLTIGPASCTVLTAYEVKPDDDLTPEQQIEAALTPAWHGWIEIGGDQRRVSVDVDTGVLTFHEVMQRHAMVDIDA